MDATRKGQAMSEKSDRAAATAHAALAKRAIALIREHGDAVCLGHDRACELSPDDDDAVMIQFDGDTGILRYTDDNYDTAYARTFAFDARCLWSKRAVDVAKAALAKRLADADALYRAQQVERERAQYEALRRKFDPTGDLRGDIKAAMALHERIAEEDA